MPHNFHHRDPSRGAVSGVRINLDQPREKQVASGDLKERGEAKPRVEKFGGVNRGKMVLREVRLRSPALICWMQIIARTFAGC